MKHPIRYFFSQTNLLGTCALFVSSVVAVGCAKIAGIDDSVPVDPNAASGSALCNTYCDTVLANCVDPLYVYATRDMCMGVCNKLETAGYTGNPNDQVGNSINCRLNQAIQAKKTAEFSLYCPASGPGGNGICGTNCEGYCVLMQLTCSTEFAVRPFDGTLSTCVNQVCPSLPTLDAGFDADQQSGNTINCRLYHISAANADPNAPLIHCPHAAGASPCD